jgi:hypothetical protein
MYINNIYLRKYSFPLIKKSLSDTYFHDLADFYILLWLEGHIAAARKLNVLGTA